MAGHRALRTGRAPARHRAVGRTDRLSRRRQPRRRLLVLVALLTVVATGLGIQQWGTTLAAFSGRTTNRSNAFAASATFPSYVTTVEADNPDSYERMEESPTSTSGSAATDSAGTGPTHPGAIYAGRTDGPSTWWKFDENAGTTVADSSGAADPGTLRNGTAWTGSGRWNSAAVLDGVDDAVTGATSGVRTDTSFSVSAWAYLTATGGTDRAVVSQDGTNTSGFVLGYNAAADRWQFALPTSDVASPTVDAASSTATPTLGAWTHLVGVYDDASNSLRLYVNNVLQTSGTHTVDWNATGVLAAGRARSAGTDAAPFAGRIDDVQTFRRALSTTEALSGLGERPEVQWDLDEGTGTTTADSGNDGVTGTLGAGATWTAAGHAANAVSLNGTSTGYVAGSGPATSTSAPFTVSAWVKLGSTATAMTAVSQDASVVSGFWLQYDGTKWAMTTRDSDSMMAPLHQVESVSTPVTNTWTFLTGVWDGNKVRIYVNGTQENSMPAPSVTNATGALQLGRGKSSGAYGTYWSGGIDQVRVYGKALDDSEIASVYGGGDANGSMTAGLPGALGGSQASSTAVGFAGTTNTYVNQVIPRPSAFTTECWFRASGTRGGTISAFADQPTGATSTTDRAVYMDSAGQLTYGVGLSGSRVTIRSPLAYNDGSWHYLAVSVGGAGMKLYVDGNLVVSNSAQTTAGYYDGYARVGGTSLLGWPNRPSSDYFVGSVDEVAFWMSQLPDTAIATHYAARNT